MLSASYGLFFLVEQVLATGDSLVVVFGFCPQHVDSLLLGFEVLVQIKGNVPQPRELSVLRVLDVFLLSN